MFVAGWFSFLVVATGEVDAFGERKKLFSDLFGSKGYVDIPIGNVCCLMFGHGVPDEVRSRLDLAIDTV